MARKRKTPKPARRPAGARDRMDAGALLRESLALLRAGRYDDARTAAHDALRVARTPEQQRAARELSDEALFRAAARATTYEQRMRALDEAAKSAPKGSSPAPRVLFLRGLTLLSKGRYPEALADLDAVAGAEPNRSGLAFARSLARVALGTAGPTDFPEDGDTAADGLTFAERNTLRLIAGVVEGRVLEVPAQVRENESIRLLLALAAMRGNASEAPVETLRSIADGARPAVSRLLRAVEGTAAMRAGDREGALAAWGAASKAGYSPEWLADNLAAAARDMALDFARAEQWEEVAKLSVRVQFAMRDRIFAETYGLARFHLGNRAAEANDWKAAADHWRAATDHVSGRRLAQNLALAEERLGNWDQAADAWRQMIRRRPKKADSPDYLTDAQVAALWLHAAECYAKSKSFASEFEIASCVKHALKYAGDDVGFRVRALALLAEHDETNFVPTEAERLAAAHPDSVEVQALFASTLAGQEDPRVVAAWKRVLALDPRNARAREGLAEAYVELIESPFVPATQRNEMLEQALADIPDNAALLTVGGKARSAAGRHGEAIDLLLRAVAVAPADIQVVGDALHELLHVEGGGDAATGVFDRLRAQPDILPGFWLDQAKRAAGCKLEQSWVERLFDETAVCAALGRDKHTKAAAFVVAFMTLYSEPKTKKLAGRYEQRARAEAPTSGAVEVIQAFRALEDRDDLKEAKRLLKSAEQFAKRAKDEGVLLEIGALREMMSPRRGRPSIFVDDIPFGPEGLPMEVLLALMRMFPNGPPTKRQLEQLPDEFWEQFL